MPVHWRYPQVRELLMQAANLTPIEKAERRVLVLCNSGLGIDNLDTLCIYRSPALWVLESALDLGRFSALRVHLECTVFVIKNNQK